MGLALGGLYGRQEKHDRAKEELATLQSFKQEKEHDELMDQQAQMQKAAYDKQVTDFADKLLGPDRDRINAKAKLLQARVRSEISTYGGDMSKFMANNGHMFLNDYKNALITSEESTSYLENKANMEQLVKIQMSGKGHLINQNDLHSLKEYNKNGGGVKISFTGMLNEIEMPDPNSYDYGTEIPVEDILDKNHVAIYGNYIISHPENPQPSKQDLLAFTKLNYGGKGANWQKQLAFEKEKNDREQAMAKMKSDELQAYYKSLNKTKTVKTTNADGTVTETTVPDDGYVEPNEKGFTHLITGEAYRAINSRGLRQTKVKDFVTEKDYSNDGLIHGNLERLNSKNLFASHLNVSSNSWTDIFGRSTETKGTGQHAFNNMFFDKFAPANAMRVKGFEPHKSRIAAIVMDRLGEGQMDLANGMVLNYVPGPDDFLPNGQKVADYEDGVNVEDYKGNYSVKNVFIGGIGKNAKTGSYEMVMNQTDDEGNVLSEKSLEKQQAVFGNSDINGNQLMIQLEDPKTGQVFYKSVEYTSHLAQKLNANLKELNQLKETNVDYALQESNENAKKASTKQSEANLKQSWDYLEKVGQNVFVPITNEATMLGGTYNQDVMNLAKSYYVAAGLNADSNTQELPDNMNFLMASPNDNLTAVIREYKDDGLDLVPMMKNGATATQIINAMIAFDTKRNDPGVSFLNSWKEHIMYLEKFRTSTK